MTRVIFQPRKRPPFFSLAPSEGERIPRVISRLDALKQQSLPPLRSLRGRGEGWGEVRVNRAFFFCLQLYCFLFCLAAFGAGEISRAYHYKCFDANGVLLLEGVITLRVDETVQVKGAWRLQALDKNKLKELGPQDGYGRLVGQLKGDSIFLNLNPAEFENNIYLDGKVTRANIFKISGKWGYYGFVGKLNEGNFEMVRQNDAPK